MGRYNEWGREEGDRHSSYDEGYSRRGRGRGGYRGGNDDYKRGRSSGYRGRGSDSSRGYHGGRSDEYGYSSSYRGRGRSSQKFGDDRGFRGGGGGGGGGSGGYRGRGGYREENRGQFYNRESSYRGREERGNRYDHRSSREDSYSSRGSRGSSWRSESSGESRFSSSYHENKKDVAMGIIKAMLNTMEGRSSYSSRSSRRGGRYMGPPDRREFGERSSHRHEPYRSRVSYRDSGRSRRRDIDNVQDSTADEEIETELLNCFLCEWCNFTTKQEYLDHVRGKDHLVRLKAYHDVNDSVLEILRTNARISAMQEIHENKLRDKFSDCDRCQCKIHENQKKSHTESIEHQQVKKFLNVDCCGKLNLYMDRKGWHQLSHHLLSIGHLKKVGGSKFIKEESKEEKSENGEDEDMQPKMDENVEEEQKEINGADNKQNSAQDGNVGVAKPLSSSNTDNDDTSCEDRNDPLNVKLNEENPEDKKQNPTSDSQVESKSGNGEKGVSVNEKDNFSKPEDHHIDCIQKMFEITGQPFQVYSPTFSFGEKYMVQAARFICKPCAVTIEQDDDSILKHCKSKEHYEKLKVHIEALKRSEAKNNEEEDNAELFEDLDNLETVDEAVEDEEDEEEMDEIDFSQEEVETVGEQMDSMFEAVDEATDDQEEEME